MNRLETPELRDYQREGVAFLVERTHALLADQMGLGKTVQSITALRLVHKRHPGSRSLICAPASLLRNWENELRVWAPEIAFRRIQGSARNREALYRLPIPVLLGSYDHVRTDAQLIRTLVEFEVVLLDEAQRIKNPSSSTSTSVRSLRRRRSWAMSGTPLENRQEELVSVFGFVRPGVLTRGMPPSETHELIEDDFLRRTKAQVLPELPPIEVQDLPIELGTAQREAYDQLWESRTAAVASPQAALLALITRLKQLCNRDPDSGESAKLEALQLILDNAEAEGAKVIVFSQYVETLTWLNGELPRQSHLFHGGMSETEKEASLEAFKSNIGYSLLLVSLKAGGVGLNLNEASVVVLFDRWWNPAAEAQAMERAHRFGRVEPLLVYRFLVTDSIEERIDDVLREKGLLFHNYIETADIADVTPISNNELRRVLGLPLDFTASTREEQHG